MTMAEKQYKNYDERFLKEDNASGSRPVIEYTLDAEGESDDYIPGSDSNPARIHLKKQDGSYAETQDDVWDLFIKNVIIKLTTSSGATQAGSAIAAVLNGDFSMLIITFGDITGYACTTSLFEGSKS